MKVLNSAQMRIPQHLLEDSQLTSMDVVVYCKIKKAFDSHKGVVEYPMELLYVDAEVEWPDYSQSIRRLESRGFLEYDRPRGIVKLAAYSNIFKRTHRRKRLYLGHFSSGFCKFGITDLPERREKQLSQYGDIFCMTYVYTFEDGGLAEHLESLLKRNIPTLDMMIPGGTECFDKKYFEKAVSLVNDCISSIFCGEVSVVQKEREVGSL